MQLNIHFKFTTEEHTLIFDLIDNPGVMAWVHHCRKISPVRSLRNCGTIHPPFSFQIGAWHRLQEIQQKLESSTRPMPLPVNERSEITQNHLNIWHRWFTDNTKFGIPTPEYEYDFYWLQELNQVVHELELEFHEWPKPEFPTVFGDEITMWPKVDGHGFSESGYLNLSPYRQYHSWEPADLILEQSIHGKSTLRSFLDNDNPRHWDTTGHHMTHGGCTLQITSFRDEIYQSIPFQQWLDKHDITREELWPDYPLGNIRHRDQGLLDHISQLTQDNLAISAELEFVQ